MESSMSSHDFSEYIGIPFVDHGRDESGCDCWGLVRLVYRNEYGIELSDLGPLYQNTEDAAGMKQVFLAALPQWRQVEKPEIGDVVLLRIMGNPIHVGIVIDDGKMLHVEQGLDSVVERFDSSMWLKRIEGFFRHDRK
jgi:cell wall-associated NlpC family hydrolase